MPSINNKKDGRSLVVLFLVICNLFEIFMLACLHSLFVVIQNDSNARKPQENLQQIIIPSQVPHDYQLVSVNSSAEAIDSDSDFSF